MFQLIFCYVFHSTKIVTTVIYKIKVFDIATHLESILSAVVFEHNENDLRTVSC